MTIGFIGLGNMGFPIAKNLHRSGLSVVAWNRSPEPRKLFENIGGKTESTLGNVAHSDVIIMMLTNDEATLDVVNHVLPEMHNGSILMSMSTISPSTATEVAKRCSRHEVTFVSCPVLGRPPAAEARQLFLLLSGESKAKEMIQPILKAIGQKIFDFGDDPSSAKSVKLIMNYMIFVITGMLSEVMIAAEKSGIDKRILLDTMLSTIFGAPIIKNYGTLILEEQPNPKGFNTSLASKDLALMQDHVAKLDLTLPLGEVIQHHFKDMIQNGKGDDDVTLIVSHLRERLSEKRS
jgi:3-hydroxyisobutyrate dehydrogenase-like beta-hydroxyacid dehydrogenase